MGNKKCRLYLGHEQYKILLESLIRLKNKLIEQGKYTDRVDDVIIKVVAARVKKVKI